MALRSSSIALLFAGFVAMPSAAQADEANDVMRMVSECAYVVRIAEGNGARLRNSSAIWDQAKATVSEQTRLNAREYETAARAKWERRKRVMGARDSMRKLMERAQACDAQL